MTKQSNVVDTAHGWLREAFSNVDGEVLLTSPYLTSDICSMIAEAAAGSSHDWTVITALDPRAVANKYLSVPGLQRLIAAGVSVKETRRLHAKCFIVGSVGMLGSANLTGAGLGSSMNPNRELGVVLTADQIGSASEFLRSWPSRDVSPEDLVDLVRRSLELTREPHDFDEEQGDERSLELLHELLADAESPDRALWLKLEYGVPRLEGWRGDSWFASPRERRPGFRVGDLVIICANDTKDCYAVVEVTAEPENRPADYVKWIDARRPQDLDRYPWINRTRPRLVPKELVSVKLSDLGIGGQGLRNGYKSLTLEQFADATRRLARVNAE
jgi:hypothetical protein